MLEEQRADRLDAIWKEIKGLVDLGTFSLEPLPAGQRALDSRIVLKVKYRADGSFDKNKARLLRLRRCWIEGNTGSGHVPAGIAC